MEPHSHPADEPWSINKHTVEGPYHAYQPTNTDDHQHTFDVNDDSDCLGFPSVWADLPPDPADEPVPTLWLHISDPDATPHPPMSSNRHELGRAATAPRISANERPDPLPEPLSRPPKSRNISTTEQFRHYDTLKRSSQRRTRKLACPFFQDNALNRRNHSCRSTHGGNMSDITRHIIQRHKSQVRFLKLCPTCKEYILDQRELEDFHGYDGEHCNNPRPYPRGGAVQAQWEALFKKLCPQSPRIPNPYHTENVPASPLQTSLLSSGTVTVERSNQHLISIIQDPLFPSPNSNVFSFNFDPTQKGTHQVLNYSNSVQGNILHEPLNGLLSQVREFTEQSMAQMKKLVPEDKQRSVRGMMVGEFSRHFDHLIMSPSEQSAGRQSTSIGESQPDYEEPCVQSENNTTLPSLISDLDEQDSWSNSFASSQNDMAHQHVQPNSPSDDHQIVKPYGGYDQTNARFDLDLA
ncbi:hypothetical protein K432DRAFT_451207 [Lepidopterella palustris CBS 459.81]|uniref:Uncharacterized protein n=1 Tax=Lepidopterella palustris CBS 459.81 TaxID=1314670 RepID=A0A8E2DWE2_9PEZI|nr:hypothetical protein K432DRAFT_451207 [Lepidopterella palustris CBS 459.81]